MRNRTKDKIISTHAGTLIKNSKAHYEMQSYVYRLTKMWKKL